MLGLRIILLLVWCVLVYVTVLALSGSGLAAAGDIFASDLAAAGWRAQFNVDLLSHMLLLAVWVAWRRKFSLSGLMLGVLCIMGGLYSLVYIVVLSIYHKGDVKALLLGERVA